MPLALPLSPSPPPEMLSVSQPAPQAPPAPTGGTGRGPWWLPPCLPLLDGVTASSESWAPRAQSHCGLNGQGKRRLSHLSRDPGGGCQRSPPKREDGQSHPHSPLNAMTDIRSQCEGREERRGERRKGGLQGADQGGSAGGSCLALLLPASRGPDGSKQAQGKDPGEQRGPG